MDELRGCKLHCGVHDVPQCMCGCVHAEISDVYERRIAALEKENAELSRVNKKLLKCYGRSVFDGIDYQDRADRLAVMCDALAVALDT